MNVTKRESGIVSKQANASKSFFFELFVCVCVCVHFAVAKKAQ